MAFKVTSKGHILALLTSVYAFNFIDRQILGVLAPFIAADLGFNDTKIGLLTGFVFATFYTTLALPIAWLADRANRVTIVSVSLAIWSFFTFLSGFATSFMALALMRIGVAIGEAGGSPPSHSILSDLYGRDERSRAMGIFSLGIPIGVALACFIAAALSGANEVNWRLIFFVVGLPGILMAIILKFCVDEPKRGQKEGDEAAPQLPFKEGLKKLFTVKSYWAACFGIAFASFGSYAMSAFGIAFATRIYEGLSYPVFLTIVGIVSGTMYFGGVYIGGIAAERMAARNVAGYGWSALLGSLLCGVCVMASLWAPNFITHVLLYGFALFFSGFYLGPSFSLAQNLAPVSMRATSSAVFFFVLNMIALGGGPTVIGALSDYLAQDHGPALGLKYALTWLVVSYVLSIAAYALTIRWLPADWAKMEANPN